MIFGKRRVISQITMNIRLDDSVMPPANSKLGLISTVLAVTATVFWILPSIILLISAKADYQGNHEILGLVIVISVPILHLTGLIFGIAGAFKKNSKKLFSIIGIVYNAVCLIIMVVSTLFILLIAYAAAQVPWR